MTGKKAGKINESPNESLMNLLNTAEVAAVLRISRRTVEDLGNKYDRAKAAFPTGEPPPSAQRFGLRRTPVMNDCLDRKLAPKSVSHYLEPIRMTSTFMAANWPNLYMDICKGLRMSASVNGGRLKGSNAEKDKTA